MIPYGRQNITEADIAEVVNILKSDWLTQGPVIPQFEQAVADNVNAKYGVACNSATSALHVACLALGLGPNDILWTSPNTFVASANCGLYCGANVDFVDIDPETLNISVRQLEEKLIQAAKVNRLPKILIPVHFAGLSCDMEEIYKLSKQYGFKIIEDASHAIGGEYNRYKIGSCKFSDITIFSFHPVKIITTGEGGMAMTNDDVLYKKMQSLRSHGITRDPSNMHKLPDGPWYYEQLELGFNYRITDIQAALGLSQLSSLAQNIDYRNKLAINYQTRLMDLPIRFQTNHMNGISAYHLFIIRVQAELREKIVNYLRKQDIGVNVHYIPVHLQPYYRNLGFQPGQFPCAEEYYHEAISLPMYSTLTIEQQDTVIEHLYSVFLN